MSSHPKIFPHTPWPQDIAQDYRAKGLWRDLTLYEHFAHAAHAQPQRIALTYRHSRMSYRELLAQVHSCAGGLLALGLRQGDAIVLQCPNVPEFFVTLLACCQVGIVPVLALPGHGAFELQHFSQQVAAKLTLVPEGTNPSPSDTLSSTLCANGGRTIAFGSGEWQRIMSAPPYLSHDHDQPVALLQVSGGTTGLPKLIPRTHNDYACSIVLSNSRCGVSAATVMLIALPVSHNFPLSSPGALGALFRGAEVVLAPEGRAGIAMPLIAQHRVTTVALVPALLHQWLMASARHDLSSLQTVQVGGQRLDPLVAEQALDRLGCQIQQVFGMAEGLVCYTPLDADRQTVVQSQGLPMSADDEILVVDDNDRPVPDGTPGQLLTRGPYTVRGYFDAPEHNAKAFTPDGYYRTGDTVALQANGHIHVLGRTKDQINRGGEKISCLEVETLALQVPSVQLASLVAVPDRYLGEKSLLYVVAAPPTDAAETVAAETVAADIRAHLSAIGVAAYKIPDRIETIPEMPKTAVGKIDKKALRRRALRAAESSPHRSQERTSL